MKQQHYTTTTTNNNRIDLLKDWHGGTHCDAIFEKLEAVANNAIIKCYKNGVFNFINGEPPRNGADMFDCMPYTDTSDFAAAWVCNWEITNTANPSQRLKGVALGRISDIPTCAPRAVLFWQDENGGDLFEVIGDELPTLEEVNAARVENAEAVKKAACTVSGLSDKMRALPWGRKMSDGDRAELNRLAELQAVAADERDHLEGVGLILRHNARALLAARACPVLAELFSRNACKYGRRSRGCYADKRFTTHKIILLKSKGSGQSRSPKN